MDRASLAEVLTTLGAMPTLTGHMTATAPRFSFYYGYYS